MKLKLIGCDALWRELCSLAALSPHEIELVLLPHGDGGAALSKALRDPTDADYIALGFGLCATEGLAAGQIPLVIPAAHDCAHLLLGCGDRYRRAFSENEDQPRWLSPAGCRRIASRHGAPCAVVSPLGPRPALPEGTREYAADLSLLRDLINGQWDGDRFLTVAPGFCVRPSYLRGVAAVEPV